MPGREDEPVTGHEWSLLERLCTTEALEWEREYPQDVETARMSRRFRALAAKCRYNEEQAPV
jgi:hypothetical protein